MSSAPAALPVAAASSVGAADGGEGFADLIAAAMSAGPSAQSQSAQSMSAELSPSDAGIDVPGLLGSPTVSPEGDTGVPVPTSDGPRLDRDAEAEGLQGALATMLLGALMRPAAPPPAQAMTTVAAPIAAVVAGSGAADGVGPEGLTAVMATAAHGGARVATAVANEVPAPAEGEPQGATAFALSGAEPLADATMAYAAPAVAVAPATRRQSVDSVGPGEPIVPVTPGESAESVAHAGAVAAPVADGAEPTAGAPLAQSTIAGMALAAVPAVAMPLVPVEAEASEVAATGRSIELTDVRPAERRMDDSTTAVAGMDVSRPAPFDSVATAAAAPQVIAARDGQSLASAVANSVQQATLRGDHEMTLALNPPDLGHLSVHITEGAAGGVSISIHATSTAAHDLLQQHLPALRSGLEQREVRVEQLRVDQQASSAAPGWADGGGRESRGRRDSGEDGQPQWSPLASLRRAAEAALPVAAVTAPRSSAVDVRA
jgi:hypothetical protein